MNAAQNNKRGSNPRSTSKRVQLTAQTAVLEVRTRKWKTVQENKGAKEEKKRKERKKDRKSASESEKEKERNSKIKHFLQDCLLWVKSVHNKDWIFRDCKLCMHSVFRLSSPPISLFSVSCFVTLESFCPKYTLDTINRAHSVPCVAQMMIPAPAAQFDKAWPSGPCPPFQVSLMKDPI